MLILLQGFTQSAKSLTRESAARIIGHLVYLLPQEQAITFTRNTLKDTYSTVRNHNFTSFYNFVVHI